ncbi:helicase-associated domain-containing protein [Streptomyces sp. JH14]|uniref:helicase C-terminal domain-containing protein n=1 Tax=Streptomyces sp. JH14 TaxID=2793630 RepID=UPI0023FA3B39|nr:helicase-associated domain-containing protein [Streptomyces sp. JH14]MDF6045630.1 helicase-associated domain-containing protein [Streptomyces sp. JH14]
MRSLGAQQLRRLLDARPDAAVAPDPRSLGELAERLQRIGSVVDALNKLPLPCLQLAQALAALPQPTHRTTLETLLGTDAQGISAALDTLTAQALVWPDLAGRLHMAPALRGAWESPLGLGQGVAELLAAVTSAELGRTAAKLGLRPGTRRQDRLDAIVAHHQDPHTMLGLLASAPPSAREALTRLLDPEEYHEIGRSGTGERWLLERALLVVDQSGYGLAHVPAEVRLAQHGPDWHAPFDPQPPTPALVAVTEDEIEREAAAASTSFAGQATVLLARCAERPVVALKSGGVGARELARLGKENGCEEAVVRLVLECAYAAGLVEYEGTDLAVTDAYDVWASWEPAERLVLLLRAWWLLGLTPTGSRDEDGKAVPAVRRAAHCTGCATARQGVLSAAASLPPGHGARAVADLGSSVSWFRPLADELPDDATPFASVAREAELLGTVARGALTPLGAALLGQDQAALRDHARRLLPDATDRARIGADLTAVVTGTPTAGLAALLDSLADRETRSAASVWRFSPASLRRALDAGHTPDRIEADLREVTDAALPQALSYLITDAARRHGRIRLAPAACALVSEDPALLVEVAAHRGLTRLGLRSVAPTVLLCRAEPDAALAALRAAGFSPVATADDGSVRVERPGRRRVSQPAVAATATVPAARRSVPEAGRSADLAARLLAAPDHAPQPCPGAGVPYGSDTEEILDGTTDALPLADVRQLAYAIDEGEPITIEYIAASGSRTVRTVSELDFDPPYLYGYCHLRQDNRVFALSRIQAVLPA